MRQISTQLAMRDILVLVCCFLLGLRAVDIEVVNVDHIKNLIRFQTDVNLSSFDLIVCDGKTTKENAERYTVSNSSVSFDIVSMMELFLAQTSALYQKGVLTDASKPVL